MARLGDIRNNQQNTYKLVNENGNAEVAQRVSIAETIGSVLNSVNWDGGSLALPDAVTEIYSFKTGGSSGTTVATVTLVYTSAAKTYLLTWDIVVV
jgi:hypothetical protein